MRIKPFGKYVLIKCYVIDRVGSVLLAPISWEYPLEAVVIDVGDEVKKVKKNDIIVYSIWGTKTLPYNIDDTQTLALIKEDDILAIVEK